jgi:hypothetical protein
MYARLWNKPHTNAWIKMDGSLLSSGRSMLRVRGARKAERETSRPKAIAGGDAIREEAAAPMRQQIDATPCR